MDAVYLAVQALLHLLGAVMELGLALAASLLATLAFVHGLPCAALAGLAALATCGALPARPKLADADAPEEERDDAAVYAVAAGTEPWDDAVAAFLPATSCGAATTAIALWTLSQGALELLLAAGRLLSVVSLGLSGLVLPACSLAAAVTAAHPAPASPPRALGPPPSRPAYERLLQDVSRLSQLAAGLDAWLQAWSPGPLLARGRRRVLAAVRPPRAAETLGAQEPQDDQRKCVICRDRSKCMLLLPCRHLCLCHACAELLTRQPAPRRVCPLCRRAIQRILRVYL